MTEATGRLQPEVSFRKVETSSGIVPSSTRIMARKSPLPEPGRAGGKHWSDRINAQGFLPPSSRSRILCRLSGQLEQFREEGLKLVEICSFSL